MEELVGVTSLPELLNEKPGFFNVQASIWTATNINEHKLEISIGCLAASGQIPPR